MKLDIIAGAHPIFMKIAPIIVGTNELCRTNAETIKTAMENYFVVIGMWEGFMESWMDMHHKGL